MGWVQVPLLLMALLGAASLYSSVGAVDRARAHHVRQMVAEHRLLDRLPFPVD